MKHIKEEHNKKSDESNSPKRKVSRTVGEYIGKEDNFQDPNARIEEEENEVDNSLMDHEETKSDVNSREEVLKRQISAANERMQLLEQENKKLSEANKFFIEKSEAASKLIQLEVVNHEGDEDLKRRIVATNTRRLELEEENRKLIEAYKYSTGEVKAAENKYEHVRNSNIEMINTMANNFQGKLDTLELIISRKNNEIEILRAENLAKKDTEAPEMVEANEDTENTSVHSDNLEPDSSNTSNETVQNNEWQVPGGNRFECPVCGYVRYKRHQFEKHMKLHEEEEEDSEYNCRHCPFQTINKDLLRQHINEAHKTDYSGRSCEMVFENKNNLDTHILDKHKSRKPCKYFASNSCEYDDECRFNHIILKQGEQICYKCGKIFDRKSSLLNHIKNNHDDPCLKHSLGKCTYGSRCVFKHTTSPAQSVNKEVLHRP